jgi:hypothetical protein
MPVGTEPLRSGHQTSALIAALTTRKGRYESNRVPQCVLEDTRQPGADKRPSGPFDENAPHARSLNEALSLENRKIDRHTVPPRMAIFRSRHYVVG